MGVDQPIHIQYIKWLTAALKGDLGISFSTTRPVADMIMERMPATLELMASSFLFAAIIAIILTVIFYRIALKNARELLTKAEM